MAVSRQKHTSSSRGQPTVIRARIKSLASNRRPTRPFRRKRLQFQWAKNIAAAEWRVYADAIHALREAKVDFLLGGGFALASFTGRWRDTKDIDFYIRRNDRARAVRALAQRGFDDYYDRLPYDRRWIYRSVRQAVIVDLIWAMANQRAQVDEAWIERANTVIVRGETLSVIPMEEFIWCKLYILQRDHCDWTDLCNLFYAHAPDVDWDHLVWRLEDDTPVLKAVLTLYEWLCPKRARLLPASLRARLGMPPPGGPPRPSRHNRIRLLDSRDWFAALQPRHKKLEV